MESFLDLSVPGLVLPPAPSAAGLYYVNTMSPNSYGFDLTPSIAPLVANLEVSPLRASLADTSTRRVYI